MDFGSDAEEILFGLSSQDHLEDGWDDSSDDEMLDALNGDEDVMSTSIMFQAAANETAEHTSIEFSSDRVESGFAVPDRYYSALSHGFFPNSSRDSVIVMIENILESIVGKLLDDAQLSITLRTRSRQSRQQLGLAGNANLPRTQDITYPGNNVQDAWRFSKVTCKS
jgi:meiotic recombination protein SPO11